MKLRYVFVITFISFNITFAYQLKQEKVIEYSKKHHYKNLINKANELCMKNELDKSLNLAQKAYELKPDKDALLIMARIYNYKKDFKNLKLTAKKILEISPKNYLGNIYLANAYLKEDKAKSKEILCKLLKKYPEDETVLNKLKVLNEV